MLSLVILPKLKGMQPSHMIFKLSTMALGAISTTAVDDHRLIANMAYIEGVVIHWLTLAYECRSLSQINAVGSMYWLYGQYVVLTGYTN